MRYSKNSEFWLSLIILLVTFIASNIFFFAWYNLTFFLGPYLFSHWFSLIGFLFVSILLPIYYLLRRKRPQNSKVLLRIHVFGNLFSFFLISSHFAQHLGRLAATFPYLETGIISFVITGILVTTGFFERFRITGKQIKYIKNIHRYITLFFYLIIIIHTLQGFNII